MSIDFYVQLQRIVSSISLLLREESGRSTGKMSQAPQQRVNSTIKITTFVSGRNSFHPRYMSLMHRIKTKYLNICNSVSKILVMIVAFPI
jgi:hypothetical protein